MSTASHSGNYGNSSRICCRVERERLGSGFYRVFSGSSEVSKRISESFSKSREVALYTENWDGHCESSQMKSPTPIDGVLGRGVYGASEALRLINFRRQFEASTGTISRQTIARWLRGYDYVRDGVSAIPSRCGNRITRTRTTRSSSVSRQRLLPVASLVGYRKRVA
jgi:hypothetical protein